jgi:hypothetical protein
MLAAARELVGQNLKGSLGEKINAYAASAIATPAHKPYSDLKNGLLYADKVYWLPLEVFTAAAGNFLPSMGDPQAVAAAVDRDTPEFSKISNEILESGALSSVTTILDIHDVIKVLTAVLEHFNAAFESSPVKDVPRALDILLYSYGSALSGAISESLLRARDDSKALIGWGGAFWPVAQQANSVWDAYGAAINLTGAMSGLFLPDVADLPIDAIVELRDHVAPALNPMRAEMLRLTEALRGMVDSGAGAETIQREARNLIAVRVEPIVREAAVRADELSKKKWRKFYAGIVKTLGFGAAAYLSPSMISKAVGEALATAADVIEMSKESAPATGATAEFVLSARAFLIDNQQLEE